MGGSVIDDPFLNYFALGLLIFVIVVIFYGYLAIDDIPYRIAEKRNHPHQDAIYAAGWVSMFTLHALWPFLWIWAMAYRPERGWGFADPIRRSEQRNKLSDLNRRISDLEYQVEARVHRRNSTTRLADDAGAERSHDRDREL